MPETHQALLYDKAAGTHVLVEVGKSVDGFTVEDIDEDEVTLVGDGGTRDRARRAGAGSIAATMKADGKDDKHRGDQGTGPRRAPAGPVRAGRCRRIRMPSRVRRGRTRRRPLRHRSRPLHPPTPAPVDAAGRDAAAPTTTAPRPAAAAHRQRLRRPAAHADRRATGRDAAGTGCRHRRRCRPLRSPAPVAAPVAARGCSRAPHRPCWRAPTSTLRSRTSASSRRRSTAVHRRRRAARLGRARLAVREGRPARRRRDRLRRRPAAALARRRRDAVRAGAGHEELDAGGRPGWKAAELARRHPVAGETRLR